MDTTNKTILVIGATGLQGGAVARHLLLDGWRTRTVTRDPDKPAGRDLARAGVEVMAGNLDDRPSLDRALSGAYGVFGVTQFWESGVEGEVRQGKALADAARAAGVQHLIYSSMGGADRQSGVPHAESKWEVERHIRATGLSATILRPVFFMENFERYAGPKSVDGVLTLTLALPPDRTLQMIAVDDIGAFAALAFARPQEFIGQGLELAGDELTGPQIAEAFSRVSGVPARFVETPLEQLRSYNPQAALMYDWFRRDGYHADIDALRRLYPRLKTLETWLRERNWRPAG